VKPQKTTEFIRCVEERSHENKAAFALLMQNGLLGPALALVRQELDSMIRVIWLIDSCSQGERTRLIEDALQGKHWQKKTTKGKLVRITDAEMSEAALGRHRWIEQVYRFGCHLVHLSSWHNYRHRDPVKNLAAGEREDVKKSIEDFHQMEIDDLSFSHIEMHAPYAMEKISSNLASYLRELEKLP
jgi:hypothetical protein